MVTQNDNSARGVESDLRRRLRERLEWLAGQMFIEYLEDKPEVFYADHDLDICLNEQLSIITELVEQIDPTKKFEYALEVRGAEITKAAVLELLEGSPALPLDSESKNP